MTKKIALLLFLLFFMSTPVEAANFVKVTESSNNYIIYVDVDSIQEKDNYIVAWAKWVPVGSAIQELRNLLNKEITHYLVLSAYHENYRQGQTLSRTYYDKARKEIVTDSYQFDPSRYEEISRGSVGESIYDFVVETYHAKIQPKPTTPPSMSSAVGEYLGIAFAPNKTPDGYFLVSSVVSGGISDFAGVKIGEEVIKIDTYDLKEHGMERVSSYIALRYQQRAIIKATIDRQKTKKVIEIQL